MKFTTVTSLLALAAPFVVARPATKAVAPVERAAAPFDFATLAERGFDLFNDFLNENLEHKPKRRSIAVREVAITMRDQLHSGDLDLNKMVDTGVKTVTDAATSYDINGLVHEGFEVGRTVLKSQDLNKLAQEAFDVGSSVLTRRETWDWAGFFNGPVFRTAAKVGVSLAKSALSKIDLNALAGSMLTAAEKAVGAVDMNQIAGEAASVFGGFLKGVDINSVMKTFLGFVTPKSS